ncbi:DUF3693 domain-containing protein [Photobacterium ganghwense]|uniref:DUF3693 domain-containing protein n=1 Tax=Photobacterium ganghwense TaxID=320778 RepID=UPI001A8F52DA|nr:DUF3693 domain-containing protein [Photobacterium ganghwense]QSV17315.1 hypothetical protein FH974_20520 [Photobacterium ganghwense]
MYQTKLLDSYKTAKNYIQDKQIAADLGLPKQRISEMRTGKRYLSDTEAVFLAQECNIDPKEALVAIHADRTQNSSVKALWEEIAKKLNSQGFQTFGIGFSAISLAGFGQFRVIAQCALCTIG